MISDTLRLELEAFDIKVIELKTGLVRTKFSSNVNSNKKSILRAGSIYEPAREKMEKILLAEAFNGNGTDPQVWAKLVVNDVLKKNPSKQVYRGESAWYAWLIPKLPFGFFNGTLKKAIGLDVVQQILKAKRMESPEGL